MKPLIALFALTGLVLLVGCQPESGGVEYGEGSKTADAPPPPSNLPPEAINKPDARGMEQQSQTAPTKP